MLAEERQARDGDIAIPNLSHFRNLNYVPKSTVFQKHFEGGVLKMTAAVAWNYDIFYLVPDLQQRFKQHMVLVIVRDQHIVNRIGQIEIGVTRDIALIGIAEHRIE